MSLADVQREVQEQWATDELIAAAGRVSQLVFAIQQLSMIRNRPRPDLTPEAVAQRKALLEITIKITKAELHNAAKALDESLKRWETK